METMRLQGCTFSAAQLLRMLEDALQKEQEQWKPAKKRQGDEVSASQRNDTIHWFAQLNRHFNFYPETYFLSTAMLDKVLRSVKVRPRYLKCIGIACFYIAAKTLEEDEMVPSTLRFIQQSGCGCSVAEVLRMEKKVLDILEWNLRLVTPLDFLHILHSSLLCNLPHLLVGAVHMTPGRQLALLSRKLEAIMLCDASLNFPPSLLALATLSLELQQFLPEWFTVVHIMQQYIQTTDEELIRCSDYVSFVLSHYDFGLQTSKSKKRCKSETPTKKRKVADSDEEDDNIYEGIKRLYSDDDPEMVTVATQADTAPLIACGVEHRQEEFPNATLQPSLQAVAN